MSATSKQLPESDGPSPRPGGELPAVQLIADAVADAAREAARQHCPDSGGVDSYTMATALFVASGMLLGATTAECFLVFQAERLLGESRNARSA